MKVVIVGLGSMGKRRARLLKKIIKDVTFIGIDQREDRRQNFKELYNCECLQKLDECWLIENIDFSIVATAPDTHGKIALEFLKRRIPVFSELNLIAKDYDEIEAICRENNTQYFISSTMLYREEIGKIVEKTVVSEKPLLYQYHVGQYLPDWHPWEHFSDFFVGNQETNGCRELLAIELPWLLEAFGEIESIQIMSGSYIQFSPMYRDCYMVQIKHQKGHMGQIIIDLISRVAVRELKITSENMFLRWNGTPDSLSEYDIDESKYNRILDTIEYENDPKYASNIIEDAYSLELSNFMEYISGINVEVKHNLEKDRVVLEWIDKIEGL